MADDSINVKVTAEVNEFAQGMKSAADSTGQFDAAINKAAADAQKLNPTAFKTVAQELNAGAISAETFAAKLTGLTANSTQAATASVNLAHGSSAVTREVVVLGREMASGNFNRLPGSLAVLLSRMNLLTPATFAVAAAVAGIGYAMFESAAQAERFDESMARIQARLQALGEGASFDPKKISALIEQLRILPGVDTEAATAIVENFSTASNIGGDMVAKLTALVGDFATATGTDATKAASELAKAFDEPEKSGEKLAETLHLFSPAEQQAFNDAKALNNVAQEQAILFAALSDRITDLREKSLTPMQQADEELSRSILDLSGHVGESDTLWQRMGRSIQQDTVFLKDMTAAAVEVAGHLGEIFDSKTYTQGRLPRKGDAAQDSAAKMAANSPASPSVSAQAAPNLQADAEKRQREINDAISDGVQLYDKGNSPLREQEQHLQRIQRLQGDLNAAVAVENGDAAQKIQAAINQENKQYSDRLKRQQPKAPKDNSDRDMERELADEQKAQQVQIEGDKRVADEKIRTAEVALQKKAALGEISVQQEIAQEIEATNQKHALDNQSFDALLSRYKNDEAQYNKTLADKLVAEQRYQQQVMQLQTKASEDQKRLDDQDLKRREQMFAPVTKAFSTSIQGMVQGTQNFQNTVNHMGQSIAAEFANNAAQMAAKWVATELQKTEANLVGNAARTNADQSGQEAGLVSHIEAAGKHILTDAGEVFGNVFAYLSPDIGPFAAVPAAAAAAAVLAVEIPSAAGGMIVPNDTLAMVHENEMVLPARYTSGLTSMIDQANGGGGVGGGHTFNNTFNLSGVQAKDIPGMIDSHIQKQARNGAYGGMRTTR